MTIHSRRAQHHSQHRGRLTRADKMNIVLLITVTFTLALVHGTERPCLETGDTGQYKRFVDKHIFVGPKTVDSLQTYLNSKGICGDQVPSFLDDEQSVKQICGTAGRYLRGNLCISQNTMLVVEVTSARTGSKCTVSKVTGGQQHVIVACDKFNDVCLPVHYEKYKGEVPDAFSCR